MANVKNQKYIGLMILEYLYMETNNKNPATVEDILQRVGNKYDINLDRRNIYSYVKVLQNVMGYKQVKSKHLKHYTRKCIYWWED